MDGQLLRSTRDLGQVNVCMDGWKERREVQWCSLAGACKVKTGSKDWVWLERCTPFFFCFNVWFSKNAWHSISETLYKQRWESPLLVLLLETFPAFVRPMQNEQHKHIQLPQDKDSSEGSACRNTIAKDHQVCEEEEQGRGFMIGALQVLGLEL